MKIINNKPCLFALAALLAIVFCSQAYAASVCVGTHERGSLIEGVKLPLRGDNYSSYSTLGSLLGRTYVHEEVLKVVLGAYGSLKSTHPEKVFVYGETGFKEGGEFELHKTHRNGLSVDFMVPVLNTQGESLPLPTGFRNKYGYAIEFDRSGRYKNLNIDFSAMASHLEALRVEAARGGVVIKRVIFDPALQSLLFKTPEGRKLKKKLRFTKKQAWVRHDEHYHVDFTIKCKP